MQAQLAADIIQKFKKATVSSHMRISQLVSCFCTKQSNLLGGTNLIYETWDDSLGRPTEVCAEWLYDTYKVKGFSYFIGFVIQTVNVFLKKIIISIIKKTKFHTVSDETSAILISVFFAQLFNTAFMVLLLEANFSEFENPLLSLVFN